MNKCILSESENAILIKNIDVFDFRSRMKISIFLKSIKSVDLKTSDNEFECVVNVDNDLNYSEIVKKIYMYLVDISTVGVDISTNLLDCISKLEKNQKKTQETKYRLLNIKQENNEEDINFDEFCKFCDRTLTIKLRDYQYKSAYLFVIGNGGFEFSVPGSGKTIITYAAYGYFKTNQIVSKILIIGPNNSYNAWWDEYRTCFGLNPDFENLAIQTTSLCKTYLRASSKNHKEITFINYDKIRLLEHEISIFLQSCNFLLIFDEAHYLKNPEAITTKKALSITRYATSRILLTGTPMPNGYEDLSSITNIFSPFRGILPYRYDQLRSMSKNEATGNQIQVIRDSIYPYYSRISKKHLIEKNELKPPKFVLVKCEMDQCQLSLYDRLNDFCGRTTDGDLDEEVLKSLKKALLIRKMQISANPLLLRKNLLQSMDEFIFNDNLSEGNEKNFDSLVKADNEIMKDFHSSEIFKIVNDYGSGRLFTNKNKKAIELALSLVKSDRKVIMWDIFVDNMFFLYEQLDRIVPNDVEIICGTVDFADRQEAIKRFREGNSMILIANPATLAESISLHRCCQNAIYVNRNFNAAQFIQSKDRIHRINMPEGTTATYYFLENDKSVDCAIDEKLNKKESRMLKILDAENLEIGGAEFEDRSIMSDSDVDDCYMK